MAAINILNIGGTNYDINDKRIPGVATTATNGSTSVITSGGVYTIINNLPQIYAGTTEPSNSLGKNGDIYLMYED